jgi:hypothetical protein
LTFFGAVHAVKFGARAGAQIGAAKGNDDRLQLLSVGLCLLCFCLLGLCRRLLIVRVRLLGICLFSVRLRLFRRFLLFARVSLCGFRLLGVWSSRLIGQGILSDNRDVNGFRDEGGKEPNAALKQVPFSIGGNADNGSFFAEIDAVYPVVFDPGAGPQIRVRIDNGSNRLGRCNCTFFGCFRCRRRLFRSFGGLRGPD